MGTVMWCLGAALRVLGSNKASIPIRTFYSKKYSISCKRGLHVSKEFQKQWVHKPCALSTSAQDRGFCGNPKYDDDEHVPVDSTPSVDGSDFKIAGETSVTIFNKTEAPPEETNFQVMLEILGKGSGRPGVDLVTVLDVGSFPCGNAAREDRIAKLKIVMQFLVNKLSPVDRLSVIRLSHSSTRLCPLRPITEKSKTEMTDIINTVDDGLARKGGGTSILSGLQEGLKVLNDRRSAIGRVPAIILMSGGYQNIPEVPLNSVFDVPVHTVGFGQDYNHKVLRDIACNSLGGTFSDVEKDHLSKAFSQCLAGLLTVAVHDLTMTVTEKSSTIDKVSADDYPQKIVPGFGDSPPRKVPGYVTVMFGNLYDRELRRITVDLRLPAVPLPENTSQVGANVLDITYSYSFKSAPTTLNITREDKPGEREKELENETSKTVGDERSRTVDDFKI